MKIATGFVILSGYKSVGEIDNVLRNVICLLSIIYWRIIPIV